MRARPADAGKRRQLFWRPFQPDEPIAAVRRRSKHGIGAAETPEGLRHMDGTNRGDVAADDDRRARRQKREETLHAPAKIALALRQPTDPAPRRPKALCDILVRSNGEYRAPARVARQSQCRMGEAAAIEAQRGDVADLAPQPPLEAA